MYSSIYRVQSSTRRLPIQALFGFMLKLVESYFSPSPQSLGVVVCPWCQPWVASVSPLQMLMMWPPRHGRHCLPTTNIDDVTTSMMRPPPPLHHQHRQHSHHHPIICIDDMTSSTWMTSINGYHHHLGNAATTVILPPTSMTWLPPPGWQPWRLVLTRRPPLLPHYQCQWCGHHVHLDDPLPLGWWPQPPRQPTTACQPTTNVTTVTTLTTSTTIATMTAPHCLATTTLTLIYLPIIYIVVW